MRALDAELPRRNFAESADFFFFFAATAAASLGFAESFKERPWLRLWLQLQLQQTSGNGGGGGTEANTTTGCFPLFPLQHTSTNL